MVSKQGNSKRNGKNKMWASTWPLSTLPKHPTHTVSRDGLWKIMAKFGCLARFIAMIWQFHDGMLAWVQSDGEYSKPFPCNKWSQARLCTGTSTVQHDVLRHALRCFSGLWWWLSYQIPLPWQAVQPKKVASQIQGADRSDRWASLCWWHGKEQRGKYKKPWIIWASSRENLSSGFATRVNSNCPAQSQKLARGLKFQV